MILNFNYYGYDVKLDEESKTNYLDGFPDFPNKNKKSTKTFKSLEKIELLSRNIIFPIKYNITERVIELNEDTKEYFSFDGITKLINEDVDLFLNTKTFFKLKIVYRKNILMLIINFYSIDNDGQNKCNSIDDLLEIIFFKYNLKQFTKNRINQLKKMDLKIEEIKYIPLITVEWLKFDHAGNLIDLPKFKYIP